MSKRWLQTRVFAGMLAGALAVVGCTRSGGGEAAQVVADPALQKLLQHIPADTPYAFVSMGGGGTRDFIAKIYAPLTPLLTQVDGKLAALDQNTLGLSADRFALLRAVVGELRGKLSVDGLAQLGLDVEARFALYGLGVLPALRLQLRDPAALRAAIERVQTGSGVRFATRKLGDIEYWHLGDGTVSAAIAIIDDQLVAGLAPTAQAEKTFALLLGVERPARHLGGSDRFKQLLTEHDLGRISAGFIDARVLAEAFMGEGDALNRDSVAGVAPDLAAKWPTLTAECKQEIRSLVALAPRMVFGTEKIDGDGFAGKFVLELRPDVAQELMTMRAAVPGLDAETMKTALFAMGAGFDVARALTFAQSRAAAIQAAPYTCPALADINNAAIEAGAELKKAPTELLQARGGTLVAEELKLAGFIPTTIRGYVSVASADVLTLLRPLMNMPPFAGQTIKDDGSVVSLSAGAIPFLTDLSFAAQAGKGAVLAVGAGSADHVKSLLGAPPPTDPPLLVMVYDMGRIGGVTGQLMGASGQTPPEMQVLLDFYKAFGSVVYDAHATERGVVMSTRMTLR